MARKFPLLLLGLSLLAGCGPSGLAVRSHGGMPAERLLAAPNEQQEFSYTHFLSLLMDHDSVGARYEKARQTCLRDTSLQCNLMSASLTVGSYDSQDDISGSLELALPHDKVATFEQALMQPVQGDSGGVEIRSRSTRAESVENQAGDADRKVAQLSRYRDGLNAIAKRSSLSVDDYIKIQSELSKTEADLAAAQADQRDVHERIARDRLSINLDERGSVAAPITLAWRNARETLIDNTGSALRFAIGSIPWLPLAALAILAVRFLWRIARRRPAVAHSGEAKSGE